MKKVYTNAKKYSLVFCFFKQYVYICKRQFNGFVKICDLFS